MKYFKVLCTQFVTSKWIAARHNWEWISQECAILKRTGKFFRILWFIQNIDPFLGEGTSPIFALEELLVEVYKVKGNVIELFCIIGQRDSLSGLFFKIWNPNYLYNRYCVNENILMCQVRMESNVNFVF